MFRRTDRGALLLALLVAAGASAQSAPPRVAPGAAEDRAVEQYLERVGAIETLVVQLQDRLARAQGPDRAAIAERLAAIIVSRLEASRTDDERRRWERAGRDLLALVPEADSFDLRLDLHRAAYTRAEQIAERWRVGAATQAERDAAVGAFTELARDLAVIGAQADQTAVRLQREEERSGSQARELLQTHLGTARRQRSLAMYLAGWCNAYLADLTSTPGRAEEALRQFGWMLAAQPGRAPTIRRLPEGTLQFDHVARSAIGVALCNAVLQRRQEALDWLDVIDAAENVPQGVAHQTPLWRSVVLVRLGLWEDLDRFIEIRRWSSQQRRHAPLPVAEARLLAAAAIAASPAAPADRDTARKLFNTAVSDLVTLGELGAVVQVVSRHGAGTLAEQGFVAHCVRGLLLYEQARDAPDTPDPPALWRRAAGALAAALESDDAPAFEAAVGEVAMTRAISLRSAAALGPSPSRDRVAEAAHRLIEASAVFEFAASRVAQGQRAAEALWMAIRCLDEAREHADAVIDEQRRDTLVAEFLSRYPNHEAAGVLLVGAALDAADPEEVISRLERVPAGSPAHEAARRHIARLLYDAFRASSERDRSWAALRYADAAESLFNDDLRRALSGDSEAAQRALIRGRRLLAALLSATPPDAVRATRALRGVEDLVRERLVDDTDVRNELLFRAAQIALARGEIIEAERTLRALRAAHTRAADAEAARLADALERSMFRAVVQAWRDARRTGVDTQSLLTLARDAARLGDRLLASDIPLEPGVIEATRVIIAEAHHHAWRLSREPGALRDALASHRELLGEGVSDRGVLRRAGELAEAAGQPQEAADAWRTLASGLDPAQAEWFEARYNFIRLVRAIDADRARALIEQHRILYPHYAPEPWAEPLRALDSELHPAQEPAP